MAAAIMMVDLFDAPLVPGLATRADIISAEDEASLIGRIDAEGLSPLRFQQWSGKRLTRSFGWSYDFESGRFARADPLPDWLEPVKVSAATFAGLAPDQLVQALLIRYDPGAGIGWHKDRPVFEHAIAFRSATRRCGCASERPAASPEPMPSWRLARSIIWRARFAIMGT